MDQADQKARQGNPIFFIKRKKAYRKRHMQRRFSCGGGNDCGPIWAQRPRNFFACLGADLGRTDEGEADNVEEQ